MSLVFSKFSEMVAKNVKFSRNDFSFSLVSLEVIKLTINISESKIFSTITKSKYLYF